MAEGRGDTLKVGGTLSHSSGGNGSDVRMEELMEPWSLEGPPQAPVPPEALSLESAGKRPTS